MKQLLTFLLIACILFACNNKTTTIENFHGMWRLDKFEAFDSLANKWTDDTSRIGHSGYIMYDGKGHMSTNPKDWGTSVVRSYKFINDTLILTPQEIIEGQRIRLRWIKM